MGGERKGNRGRGGEWRLRGANKNIQGTRAAVGYVEAAATPVAMAAEVVGMEPCQAETVAI